MSGSLTTSITSSDADDAKLVMPQLPVPLRPLSPFVDMVASVNLSIYSKSMIGFLGGALLLLLMGAFSLLILSQMTKRVEELNLAQEKMDLARQMAHGVTSQMHFRAMALLTGDDANNEKTVNAKAAFSRNVNTFRSIDPQSSLVSFDSLVDSARSFDEAGARTLNFYENGEIERAMEEHLSVEHRTSHELEGAARVMIEGANLEWTEADAAFHSDRRLLTTIVWSFSGLSVAAAVFLGIVMSWSFIRPVLLIGSVLSRVAAGDFTQRVKVPNRDELGSLVTNVNSMSQRLDNLYHDLEEANRQIVVSEKLAAIGQLSGGIAHDLRNPLGAIKNAAYLLNQAVGADENLASNAKVRRYLDTINAQIDRAERTVGDLMDYTRAQNNQGQPTDVNELIRDCFSNLEGADSIEITQNLDSEIPTVICESDQIHRVFVNLAVNACDAMPNGGRLSVSSRAEKGYVKIEFCDSGIGINDGDLGKIFDPMFTTKPGGTGFGLAVCKEIVERHGGTISVAAGNDGAKGTIFTINLPIAG